MSTFIRLVKPTEIHYDVQKCIKIRAVFSFHIRKMALEIKCRRRLPEFTITHIHTNKSYVSSFSVFFVDRCTGIREPLNNTTSASGRQVIII